MCYNMCSFRVFQVIFAAMDIRHKQIIRTNQQYICDNIDLTSILDYLISGNVISIDDLQRINKEASRSKEVEKMLRIIEMHPKGYYVFLSTLRDVQASIADRLEATPVNEDDIKHGKKRCNDKKYVVFILQTSSFTV